MTIDENLSARRAAWRRDMLARRSTMAPPLRAAADAALERQLRELITPLSGVLCFTWPIKDEFDARPLITDWLAADPARSAVLPVVMKRHTPLQFRAWTPATRMRGAGFGTSVPDEGEWLTPTTLLIPLVGYDKAGYRLGYGGGYYDRTLAILNPQPYKIGIAYADCALESIEPQDHDIRMDLLVTENGITRYN
ncbi:MAG TPA: 5-formyltetrahydrofolate cyclo-ligase [Burkholderiales bacterium]|jgi:5-formyltetrahydrofolate cyclo-ligase|nr:5-formyltetrahydrofolate cyclo-ligase [Burkholderiales bacterium]